MILKRQRLLILIAFFSAACVSIKLPPGEVKPADYKVVAPPSPFEQSHNEGAVKSWINRENGNSISVYSSCNNSADPSLESLQKEMVATVSQAEILSSAEITFNQRSALISTIEGQLDGVLVKIKSLILKKNSCHYSINYIGVKNSFATDEQTFSQFLKGFEAP